MGPIVSTNVYGMQQLFNQQHYTTIEDWKCAILNPTETPGKELAWQNVAEWAELASLTKNSLETTSGERSEATTMLMLKV